MRMNLLPTIFSVSPSTGATTSSPGCMPNIHAKLFEDAAKMRPWTGYGASQHTPKPQFSCANRRDNLAVAEGFEPSDGGYPSHAFEACSLGRSDTPPGGSLPADGGANPIAAAQRTPPAAPRTRTPALPREPRVGA